MTVKVCQTWRQTLPIEPRFQHDAQASDFYEEPRM